MSASSANRLRTIDGLRGIAALAVVAFHVHGAAAEVFTNWLSGWWVPVLNRGFLGVDVFFVISGFVIPYSIRTANLSPGFLGRFAIRRSLRLDPPYWCAIFLEVALIWLGAALGLSVAPEVTGTQVVAHMFYLQNILGFAQISPVFWTLAFEIQFYLGLILLLVVGASIREWLGVQRTRMLAVALFATLYGLSVLGYYGYVSIHPGFALLRWWQFFLGVAVYWAVAGKGRWPLVAAWCALAAVLMVETDSRLLIPLATSALLWWSHAKDGMQTVLSSRVIQWFGTISYSLYLFHAAVSWRFVMLAGRFVGEDAPLAVAFAVFVAGCAVSIAFSWMMWRAIERPAMRWSKVVGLSKREQPVMVAGAAGHSAAGGGPSIVSGTHATGCVPSSASHSTLTK